MYKDDSEVCFSIVSSEKEYKTKSICFKCRNRNDDSEVKTESTCKPKTLWSANAQKGMFAALTKCPNFIDNSYNKKTNNQQQEESLNE